MSTELAVDCLDVGLPLALPCQECDPELFFAEAPATIEYAKGVCGPCPIQQECLAGALRRGEPHGVWGGELFANGQVIAQKRPRGRPRKNPLPIVASAPEHLLSRQPKGRPVEPRVVRTTQEEGVRAA